MILSVEVKYGSTAGQMEPDKKLSHTLRTVYSRILSKRGLRFYRV